MKTFLSVDSFLILLNKNNYYNNFSSDTEQTVIKHFYFGL